MSVERDPRDVARIAELEAEVAALKRKVAELTKVVEELLKRQRKDKRQAAPFARDEGKDEADKKRSGREAGHEGAYRGVPKHVDEWVEAPLEACPRCRGPVANVEDVIQYVVDLPEVKAHVLGILTHTGWCRCCRRQVRSRHPRQVSRAGGAASVALGPRVTAMAMELKHRQGMPYRDIASFLGRYLDFPVSHGALVHASKRVADKAAPDYIALAHEVRTSALVHTDDTGWRIGRLPAWLWVFATPDATLYVIDRRRSADVVLEVLGDDFTGTLVSDGLPALNALNDGFTRAQCNGHIIRRCREMEALQTKGAVRFPRALKAWLQMAIHLAKMKDFLPEDVYQAAVATIRAAVQGLVSQDFSHEENLKLARHVFKHQEALLLFLDDPAIPPTNNLAEQELRGAVVNRKIGGCHRSAHHAHAHAVIASLAQTAHRRGETLSHHVARWMQPATADP